MTAASDPVQEILDAGGMVTDGPLPLDRYGWGARFINAKKRPTPEGMGRVPVCS
jgi:hypothetical protein